jgi:glycosyltransferase involved in cell wall biosynthesis
MEVEVQIFQGRRVDYPNAQWFRRAGIPVVHIVGKDTAEVAEQALSRLRSSPPDIYVPNLIVSGYFAAAEVARYGIPTVGVIHSDDPVCVGFVEEFAGGNSHWNVSAMVCVSRYLEEFVRQKAAADAEVKYIPYGVPIPRDSARWPDGKFRIVYSGRLSEEQKRIGDTMRQIIAALREAPGEIEAVIYGDGPDWKMVEDLIKTEGAGLDITLAGRIEPEAVAGEIVRGHAFVLLSEYEGLPIALLEAMVCGLVPICTRIRSGNAELITHGENGFLIERGELIAPHIRSLRTDRAKWERMSGLARGRIAGNYSDTSSYDRWREFLTALGGESRFARRMGHVPRRLSTPLPPINPHLAGLDNRYPRLGERIRNRLARAIGAGIGNRSDAC